MSEGSEVEMELHVSLGRVPETEVTAVSLLTTFQGGSNKSGMERKDSIMDAGLLPREVEMGLLSGEMGSFEASGRTSVTAVVLALSLDSSGTLTLGSGFLRAVLQGMCPASLSFGGRELSAYVISLPGYRL
jgi:hypothetical protein